MPGDRLARGEGRGQGRGSPAIPPPVRHDGLAGRTNITATTLYTGSSPATRAERRLPGRSAGRLRSPSDRRTRRPLGGWRRLGGQFRRWPGRQFDRRPVGRHRDRFRRLPGRRYDDRFRRRLGRRLRRLLRPAPGPADPVSGGPHDVRLPACPDVGPSWRARHDRGNRDAKNDEIGYRTTLPSVHQVSRHNSCTFGGKGGPDRPIGNPCWIGSENRVKWPGDETRRSPDPEPRTGSEASPNCALRRATF